MVGYNNESIQCIIKKGDDQSTPMTSIEWMPYFEH